MKQTNDDLELTIINLQEIEKKEIEQEYKLIGEIAHTLLKKGYRIGHSWCGSEKSYNYFNIKNHLSSQIEIYKGKSPKISYDPAQLFYRLLLLRPRLAKLCIAPKHLDNSTVLFKNATENNWELYMFDYYAKDFYQELVGNVKEIADKHDAKLNCFISNPL